MDNHPIPQDVTGFQFRLIGDMTIKQFAYLATGVILAWICFSLPLFIAIKLPLVVLFAGTGVLFAFIPLGGRPADAMILYFFKAVFSPTQYTYTQQANTKPTANVGDNAPLEKKEEKNEEKVQLSSPIGNAFDSFQKEEKKEEQSAPEAPAPLPPLAPIVSPEDASTTELNQETTALAKALQEAKTEEVHARQGTEEALEAHKKVSELESELQSIQEQKKQLEARLLELQTQLSQKNQQVFSPSTVAEPRVTENVRKVPPSLQKTVGTPFVTDVPNLICGIVKDPRGNVLPNILIEVKDKDGNPVRAFKTNPLGQFASATPVINGTYTITFEDPNGKQRFDTVELSANNEVLSPLEVISIDAREDLRKELFGG